MNSVEAIKLKLSMAHNIFQVIECAKDWRALVFKKGKMYLRVYQKPLSDKIMEYIISGGALGNEIVTLWARQSGKTETVAVTALILGLFYIIFLKEDFPAGLFAPVESMITHVTRNRLRTRYKKIQKWLKSELYIKQIAGQGVTSSLFILENELTGKEFACRSLSVGEGAGIIGESFKLLVIEQSELVNAMKLKNDVFPMGAETGGVRVLTGTTSPYFRNEYFKAAITKWSEDKDENRSTADWVELVNWKIAAKHSSAYRRYVKRELERMGEESIEFRTQFGLEWAQAALKFTTWEDLVSQEKDYVWDKERLRFFGIDVARAGDSTVVTIIEIFGTEVHILGWLELQGLDFEKQIIKIVKFLEYYKPLRFGLVDVVGLGRPLFDMLKKRLREEIEVPGIAKEVKIKIKIWARVDGYYGAVKENDVMYKGLDREFQHDRIFFPKHTKFKREKAKFIDQLLDLERKYSGHTLKLEAPKLKDRHDDYPVSLALAVYAFKEKSFKTGIGHL